MGKLCVFLGLAAIGYKLSAGAMFALLLGSSITQAISVAVGALIAARFVSAGGLGGRLASPSWVVGAFGIAGALVFILQYFSVPYSLLVLFKLGLSGASWINTVLDVVLALGLLKIAADLRPIERLPAGAVAGDAP